jgi:sugar lactone lactonase YvrE
VAVPRGYDHGRRTPLGGRDAKTWRTCDNPSDATQLHVPDTGDDAGADGIRVDRDGRLYVATRMGIQVCDQIGRVNCIIPTPNGRIANLCFGGEHFDILYATCGDKVFKRKVKVHGANAFQEPIKPATPRP